MFVATVPSSLAQVPSHAVYAAISAGTPTLSGHACVVPAASKEFAGDVSGDACVDAPKFDGQAASDAGIQTITFPYAPLHRDFPQRCGCFRYLGSMLWYFWEIWRWMCDGWRDVV